MLTQEFTFPTLVTLLSVFMYQRIAVMVGRARVKYNFPAPKIVGHEDFERTFRVQQNTLEQYPVFLVSLWLCSYSFSPLMSLILGLAWVGFRTRYYFLYTSGRLVTTATIPAYICVTFMCVATFFAVLRQFYHDIFNK